MEKSRVEIEKIILSFLDEHGEDYYSCALSTCWNNEPRNTPINARHNGLNMYSVVDPGGKIENIRKNPKVCLAIFMPVGKGYMRNVRGLQMWGIASLITRKDDPGEFEKGFATIRLDEITQAVYGKPMPEEVKNRITILKIVPDRISYFDLTSGKPEKYTWERE